MTQQNNQPNRPQHNNQNFNTQTQVQKFQPQKEDLKRLLSRLMGEIIAGKNPEQARREMHTWYHAMSTDEQLAFKEARNQADETINYFKGVIETLAQELPALFVA